MAPTSVPLEEVILNSPPAYREVIVALRDRVSEAERHANELQTELQFSRQRVVELEGQLAAAKESAPSIPAPQTNLEELIAQLKAQHQAQVEAHRRGTTEKIHNLEDTTFDADSALQSSVSRSMRPLPKSFEFIDLMQVREQFTADGFAPSSPIQQPLINEFVGHIDGVRQCTKDNRFCQLYYDPIKSDLLRRMFDMCKMVEAKMSNTSYLTLPSQSVPHELVPKDAGEAEVSAARRKEVLGHMSAIEECGEVFNRACRDVTQLDEFGSQAHSLPHFAGEFDLVTQAMANDAENLQRNELVLIEAGSLHVENLTTHRKTLQEQSSELVEEIERKERLVDKYFHQMTELLQKAMDEYRSVMEMIQSHSKTQVDIALCDHRVAEMRKAVEVEVQKQQRFLEGCKFTTFLCNKAKDMYRRLNNNLEESIRSRKDLCERVKITSQEQLYTMAEVLHDVIVKRQSVDNQTLRSDQSTLETANRSLMGLVHHPGEMDRQMESIRELTLKISNTKNRISQSTHDVGAIRAAINKYQTVTFLKRDTNFLSIYDSMEKTARIRERLDDSIQRLKYVSEILVEISDPDTRQDYVVQQCLEALKVSVADMTDLQAVRHQMESFDDAYRQIVSTKIRRHKRLVSHFLDEIKSGENDIVQHAPSIELNVVSLLEGVDNVLNAVQGTQTEDPLAKSAAQRIAPAKVVVGPDGQTVHVDPTQAAPAGDASGLPGGGAAAVEFYIEQEQHAKHTFARFSAKLKASHDLLKLTKPPQAGAIEMSNTSSLGAVGFRLGSGVHSFTIRIGPNCSRLLVGFADWNLPLDGYCNSLKYSGCYYLHVGNGSLWAPDQHMERRPYTYEAIGMSPGGLLKAVIDTNNRTIGYVWNDVNLGVAFRNINLTRTLYPAFEVFSNSCQFEFANPDNATDVRGTTE